MPRASRLVLALAPLLTASAALAQSDAQPETTRTEVLTPDWSELESEVAARSAIVVPAARSLGTPEAALPGGCAMEEFRVVCSAPETGARALGQSLVAVRSLGDQRTRLEDVLAEARLPVIVPGVMLADEISWSVGELSYSAAGIIDGVPVEVYGTRRVVQPVYADGDAPPAEPGPLDLQSEELLAERYSESIEMSFSKFGVSYSISVYCEEGTEACSDLRPWVSMAMQDMAYVGGAP